MSTEFRRAKSARRVASKEASEKKRYWIGTTEDAPKQNIDICGVGFPRWTQQVTPLDDDGKKYEVSGRKPGMLVMLSQSQVDRIKDRAELKVVRWGIARDVKGLSGDGKEVDQQYRKGTIISLEEMHKDSPQPVQHPNDEPITKYIYMRAMTDLPGGFVPAYGTKTPDSMWADMEKSGENQRRLEARIKREAAEDADERKAELAKAAAVEVVKKIQG
jgi:hypothetical protein